MTFFQLGNRIFIQLADERVPPPKWSPLHSFVPYTNKTADSLQRNGLQWTLSICSREKAMNHRRKRRLKQVTLDATVYSISISIDTMILSVVDCTRIHNKLLQSATVE